MITLTSNISLISCT